MLHECLELLKVYQKTDCINVTTCSHLNKSRKQIVHIFLQINFHLILNLFSSENHYIRLKAKPNNSNTK